MKKVCKLIFIFILFITNIGLVFAEESKNNVYIYLFHSNTCPHCKEEITYLDKLEKQYDNIIIYKYEISSEENIKLYQKVAKLYGTEASGVPFTVIGDKYFKGFSYEAHYDRFIAAIDYYSQYSYVNRIKESIPEMPPEYAHFVDPDDDDYPEPSDSQNLPDDDYPEPTDNPETPEEPSVDDSDNQTDISVDEYIEEKTNRKLNIFGFEVSLKNMALPFVSALIGLVDGFNPCAMWVLLFLISMLIGMNDKKRMWIIGLTFLFTSAFIYLLFMLAWLNAATFLLSIKYVRLVIGLIAIIGAIINLRSYIIQRKDNGCDVIDDKKRNKIFAKIKKFTHEKNYLLAIIGAMALAISVNIVELACSAGLPVMFIEILSMNSPTLIEKIIYIGLYMIFFLIDDFIVFFIAVRTMNLTGFSTKYGKISKLVGGLLLLGIGILLILKPEWLMFNF